jgi:intermediate cleaving peptidase 55
VCQSHEKPEPGVYIPNDNRFPEEYRGMGIRIEDDIVIGEDDCVVLTKVAPKEVEDIENMMTK